MINSHGMLCSTEQMLLTAYPAFAEESPVLVDWLPWNHVLGGNCNFGLARFKGGTLYIDDGKPVPGKIEETARNLREVVPLLYLSVPKGYEELVPWLRRDRARRETFVSRIRMLQYAAASIAKLAPTLAPAADHVGDVRGEQPGGWPPLESSRAGRCVSPEVVIDGRAADAQLARDGGQRHPLRPECTHGLIDGDPDGMPGRPCGPLPRLRGLGAPASSPVHGRDGDRARGRRERHRRADRGGLERRSVVDQEGF